MNCCDYSRIPERMMAALHCYLREHQPVGDFLTAVLRNDLKEACVRADDENIKIIPIYVAYLYNEAPSSSWGSSEKHRAWLAKRTNMEQAA